MDRLVNKSYRPARRIYLYPGSGLGGKHPFTQGTHQDLEAEKIVAIPGMRLDFYCDDGNDKGARDYLLFTGVLDQYPETAIGTPSSTGIAFGMNPTSNHKFELEQCSLSVASMSLDIAHPSAVWACVMKLNRTQLRATCQRRRIADDDGSRRVRRQR